MGDHKGNEKMNDKVDGNFFKNIQTNNIRIAISWGRGIRMERELSENRNSMGNVLLLKWSNGFIFFFYNSAL